MTFKGSRFICLSWSFPQFKKKEKHFNDYISIQMNICCVRLKSFNIVCFFDILWNSEGLKWLNLLTLFQWVILSIKEAVYSWVVDCSSQPACGIIQTSQSHSPVGMRGSHPFITINLSSHSLWLFTLFWVQSLGSPLWSSVLLPGAWSLCD